MENRTAFNKLFGNNQPEKRDEGAGPKEAMGTMSEEAKKAMRESIEKNAITSEPTETQKPEQMQNEMKETEKPKMMEKVELGNDVKKDETQKPVATVEAPAKKKRPAPAKKDPSAFDAKNEIFNTLAQGLLDELIKTKYVYKDFSVAQTAALFEHMKAKLK